VEQVIRIIDGLLNNQISAAFTYLIVAYLIFKHCPRPPEKCCQKTSLAERLAL